MNITKTRCVCETLMVPGSNKVQNDLDPFTCQAMEIICALMSIKFEVFWVKGSIVKGCTSCGRLIYCPSKIPTDRPINAPAERCSFFSYMPQLPQSGVSSNSIAYVIMINT